MNGEGYGMVWYYPGVIIDILYFNNVKKRNRVTYDNGLTTAF